MKNKWSKFLLAAPITAMSVLPITFFTSCSNKQNDIFYIDISDAGKTMANVIVAKKKKDLLAPETFPETLNNYYNREPLYMEHSTQDEIQSTFNDPNFRNDVDRFVIHGDWSAVDQATYTVTPKNNTYQRVVFFLHGGGYAKNLQYTHIKTCLELSEKLNAKFYIPLHPVIPQHKADECYAFIRQAYNDMCINEPDKDIIFMGDSSGGGLALAFSQLLYNEGAKRLPSARVLFSPWVDASLSNNELYYYLNRDIMLHPCGLQFYGHFWSFIEGWSVNDYRVSPINGEMRDKIKTLTFIGSEEIFYPDVRLLHHLLLAHGCNSKLVIGNGLFHDWEVFSDIPAEQLGWKKLPEVTEAYDMVKNFLEDKPLRS